MRPAASTGRPKGSWLSSSRPVESAAGRPTGPRDAPATREVGTTDPRPRDFAPPATIEEVAKKCRTAGGGGLDCKRVLADNVAGVLEPIRQRAAELKAHPERVREILAAGAERAHAVARETMHGVRERLGLFRARARAQP